VPAAAQKALADTARQLSARWRSGDVRWTPPQNQHLTLRFLGDTSAAAQQKLTAALDELVMTESSFVLHIEGTGVFPLPEKGPARVLWAGFRDDDGRRSLMALQRRLEACVRRLGWQSESRPYHPHLTLGRVRHGASSHGGGREHLGPDATGLPVHEVVLMRSDLKPSGPRYTPLHAARFGG
jgi:2'-5' RNA ligase